MFVGSFNVGRRLLPFLGFLGLLFCPFHVCVCVCGETREEEERARGENVTCPTVHGILYFFYLSAQVCQVGWGASLR